MTEFSGSTPRTEGRRGPHLGIDVFAREGQLKEGHLEQWGKHFTLMCDEGPESGTASAPSPLGYFTMGIGFRLCTQIVRCAQTLKVEISNLHIHVDAQFARSGSILGGNISGGADAVRLRVSLDSDAPVSRVREVIRLGEASCFTAGALRQVVPVELAATVNGEAMEINAEADVAGAASG